LPVKPCADQRGTGLQIEIGFGQEPGGPGQHGCTDQGEQPKAGAEGKVLVENATDEWRYHGRDNPCHGDVAEH
jgi:hypothetical protein